MRIRTHRSRLAGAIAMLAVLPGCLTGHMWSSYEFPGPVVSEHLLVEGIRHDAGVLVASSDVMANGLVWSDADGGARWQLRPSAGADVAAALLADPGLCEVRRAEIDATRRYVFDEVTGDDAAVQLHLVMWPEAIGEVLEPDDILPAAARKLAKPRRNAFVFAADPASHLPTVFRRLVQRLGAVDLGWIAGTADVARAESWLFVDADGRPTMDAASLSAADEGDDDLSLRERLDVLGSRWLLVRVTQGQRSMVLRLRPDRLWLLSGLSVEPGGFVHRSGWRLETARPRAAERSSVEVARMASTLALRELHYGRSERPVLFDEGLWGRIALTPVTLALDIVLGPGLEGFLWWLGGGDPDLAPGAGRTR